MMAEIITLGEILVEIMRPTVGQPLDRPGQFRGPFASGAPAIFAVAAARLGLDTAFIGAVGEDAFGRLLRARFFTEGVDTSGLQVAQGYATGAAFVAYDDSGGREFVFHISHAAAGQIQPELISPTFFEHVKWLHISGSTVFLNDNSHAACLRALELAKAAGGKISLDPNLRSELMPLEQAREMLAPFISSADLLLPTLVEAYALTGKSSIEEVTGTLPVNPDAIIVIKRGPEGCTVTHRGQQIDISGFAVEAIDPTGAGDCFSAAFIAGLEAGWPPEKVGRFANAAGALAVTKMGPMEGAPTRKQVEEFYA
jgi:sugar/nucleoside kinase (ribokinase family)